jgi:hypothetical protein
MQLLKRVLAWITRWSVDLLFGTIFAVIIGWVIRRMARFSYLLGENAVIGSVDDEIAKQLGITTQAALAFTWNWCVPIGLAVAAIWAYHLTKNSAQQDRLRKLIGLALTVCGGIALLVGIGMLTKVGDKPLSVTGAQAQPATSFDEMPRNDLDTHISLKFVDGPPLANHLSNIWRWYALANVVVLITPEGRKEIKTWSVFLTFDKPVNANQVVVSSQSPLPQFEVKDRESRSAVIAFMGDMKNLDLEIKVLTSVPTQPQPTTKPEVSTTTAVPPPAVAQAPIKPSKNYFPAEKKALGDLYTFLLERLNKDGMLAAKQAYNYGADTPAGNKNQLASHLARIAETQRLASDLRKYIYNDVLPNNPSYNFELSQLFSNSPDNVPLGAFQRELEKYHRAISIFVDRRAGGGRPVYYR